MESLYFHASSIRDKSYCRKSSAQKKRRDVCCTVGKKGLILCHAVAFCEMSKTCWQMNKLLMKGDTENR